MKLGLLTLGVLTLCVPTIAEGADILITIHSQPEGAAVYEQGRYWGVTPLNLKYKTPRRWKSCLTLKSLAVEWLSGAKASLDPLTACPQDTRRQQIVFQRPDAWPEAQMDRDWAFKMMTQVAVAPAPGFWESFAAGIRASEVQAPPIVIRQPVTCTSRRIFNTIYTSCY